MAARFSCASRRALTAMPPSAAAGVSTASKTVRAPLSDEEGLGPLNASTRKGTARAIAESWSRPLCCRPRPSRYRAMSTAAEPATVAVWKPARDRTTAAQARNAADAVPNSARGKVLASARSATAKEAPASSPETDVRVTASRSARRASDDPTTTRVRGERVACRALSAHRSRRLSSRVTTPLSPRPGGMASLSPGTLPTALLRATGKDRSIGRRQTGSRLRTFTSMEASIEVTGLRKRFGPAVALDGISFSVAPGQVTGFVGPNGAGKTTTIRVILGLDAADEGSALIDGQPYAALRHPLSRVGSLIDAGALHPSRTARNHLLWLAHSQGLPARRVDEVLVHAGLQAVARRKAGGLSLGMRQRLGIAASLLGDPTVLILDEPFNGMDPEGIVWMRGFLRSLAAENRALLVSSHLMSELQDAATHLVVIGRDTLTIAGLPSERVVALLSESATPFSEVSPHQATLEEAYMELTRNQVDYRPVSSDEEGS